MRIGGKAMRVSHDLQGVGTQPSGVSRCLAARTLERPRSGERPCPCGGKGRTDYCPCSAHASRVCLRCLRKLSAMREGGRCEGK